MYISVEEVDRGIFICNFHEATPSSLVGLHHGVIPHQRPRFSKTSLSAPELDHLRCFVTVTESQDSGYFLPRYKPQNTYAHLVVLLSVVGSRRERCKCSHMLLSRVGMSRGARCALAGDFIIVHSSHITHVHSMSQLCCAHTPRAQDVVRCMDLLPA